MSLDLFIKAHNWLYKDMGFIWESDISRLGKLESWVILRDPYVGDCEDAALTIMNRLLEQGVDASTLRIVRCAVERTPYHVPFNHAILSLKDGDKWYFSDNRLRNLPACTPADISLYRFYDAVSLDNLRGVGKPKLFKKD
jgi:predicted transglutaminase-like cysteine proteinase